MLKMNFRYFFVVFFLLYGAGCTKESDPFPTEIQSETIVSDVLDVSATAKSVITEQVPGTVIQYGHVWASDVSAPSLNDFKTELAGKALQNSGSFVSKIIGLKAATTYFVRSYLKTSGGVVYGRTKTFSTESNYINRLVRIIDDSLKGKGFGYSFTVSQKGKIVGSGAGGFQSRSIEQAGELPVNTDTKMQIASMTKTISAIAFMKLANEKGIKTSDPIIDYLPAYWKTGSLINKITFRDLMTHQSGIVGLGEFCQNGAFTENYWYGLKGIIAKGIKQENYGNQCYQNANFGLFRLLIPAMLGYKFSGDDNTDDVETQQIYEQYVRENILAKAGVSSDLLLVNSADRPTLGYDYPYRTGTYGFNPGNFKAVAGGYGFYLTATEAGAVYSKIFSTDDQSILTTALKDSLILKGYANYSALTPQGKFCYHDGWWYISYGNGVFQGFRSVWMKCPDDIVVVLFTNSLRNGDGLFPIRSGFYQDITSYLLWAFSELNNVNRNGRTAPVNYHQFLKNPEPH